MAQSIRTCFSEPRRRSFSTANPSGMLNRMAPSTPKLSDNKDAFVHVVYDYRYLAVAAHAWTSIGSPGAPAHLSSDANRLVPGGFGALIQDSLLIHARALVDFLTKTDPSPTDIVLGDFGMDPLATAKAAALRVYKPSIDVHVMHLTAWRDPAYRAAHNGSQYGADRVRHDWNVENEVIAELLLDALSDVATQQKPWAPAFKRLHAAASLVRADASTPWPTELGEGDAIKAYAASLNL